MLKDLNWIQRSLLILFFAAIFVYTVNVLFESDVFYDLKVGQVIWETHHFYSTDIFSYTAYGQRWIMHEWLAQLLFFGIFNLAGPWGLMVFCGIVAVITYWLIFRLALFRKANFYPAILFLFLFGYFTFNLWVPRPQIFSFLFFTLIVYLLERYRITGQNKYLYPIVLVFWLWANMNASFILGLVIVGFYLAAAIVKKYLVRYRFLKWMDDGIPGHLSIKKFAGVLGASFLIAFLNPATYHVFLYSLYIQASVHIYKIVEWKSIFSFLEAFRMQVFSAEVLLGDIFLIYWFGWKRSSRDLILLGSVLGISILPILSIRHMGFWPLIAIYPLVIAATSSLENFFERFSKKIVIVILFIAGLSFLLGRYPSFPKTYQDKKTLPVGAADFILKTKLQGPLYNFYNEGGYLIWRLWPEQKVFMDGRSEVFPLSVIGDHIHIGYVSSDDWSDLVYNKYKINYFLINFATMGKQDDNLVQTLVSHQWPLIYWDDSFVIFVKDDPKNKKIIQEYGLKHISPFRDPTKIPAAESLEAAEEIQKMMEREPDSLTVGEYARRFLLSRQEQRDSEPAKAR